MNKLILALLLTVTGCTTMHKYEAAPQNYRLKGDEKQITISGKVDQVLKKGAFETTLSSKVTIFIDGNQHISGLLDQHQSGEFSGSKFNDKPTSASCTSKQLQQGLAELRCIVFIDNERTTTLTF